MNNEAVAHKTTSHNGVIFNAYPDSIGRNLADAVSLLKRPEFKDAFSLFYILPTFFHSDLDRGFSIIDYDLNEELVSQDDLRQLDELGIKLKLDLVMNHLSVGSPQFQHMLEYGDNSEFKSFFIDWNQFWSAHGEMGADGYVVPKKKYLEKLFMRKPGLPILKVHFPDGSERPYWNTFYQEVTYTEVSSEEFLAIEGLSRDQAKKVAAIINATIKKKADFRELDLGAFNNRNAEIISIVEKRRKYLGQMDLNAQADQVWKFYDSTLNKLQEYGALYVRLDAFAYLHKQPGEVNFFNKPGTWDYLGKLSQIAKKYDLILLAEIHSEYGKGLHEEVACEGFPIYDFFLPGLVIDALDRGTSRHLLRWIRELLDKNIQTVNMLGCHDGIPVLDLKGGHANGAPRGGLLSDEEIDAVILAILDRGGRVKNLYGPDGSKISYYQVNATFFSALGESERKLLLARAIQMFTPGTPQVWYLDLFAGRNDYRAADSGGTAGHKEINRTKLTEGDIEERLKYTVVRHQLELIRLRNTSPAFNGKLEIQDAGEHLLHLIWRNENSTAELKADLRDLCFEITQADEAGEREVSVYL